MSIHSILVFVFFTQHCIQSNEVSKLNSTLYIGLLPLQKGGLIVAISPVGFKYLLTSQSKEAALLTFWEFQTTRVIAGKMHSQSLILKTKGVLSNLVILTYLWKQSCILHTLTKNACLLYKF